MEIHVKAAEISEIGRSFLGGKIDCLQYNQYERRKQETRGIF